MLELIAKPLAHTNRNHLIECITTKFNHNHFSIEITKQKAPFNQLMKNKMPCY